MIWSFSINWYGSFMSAQIYLNHISINSTFTTVHMMISLRNESFNVIHWYMVRHTWKVDVISLAIFKLVVGCPNSCDLFELSNIFNGGVTFHIINKVGLKLYQYKWVNSIPFQNNSLKSSNWIRILQSIICCAAYLWSCLTNSCKRFWRCRN